jgi:hypothetical protein
MQIGDPVYRTDLTAGDQVESLIVVFGGSLEGAAPVPGLSASRRASTSMRSLYCRSHFMRAGVWSSCLIRASAHTSIELAVAVNAASPQAVGIIDIPVRELLTPYPWLRLLRSAYLTHDCERSPSIDMGADYSLVHIGIFGQLVTSALVCLPPA